MKKDKVLYGFEHECYLTEKATSLFIKAVIVTVILFMVIVSITFVRLVWL
jgi:hypothetical protein